MTNKTPIVLDVDPGHDDAVAIMLACGSEKINLLAVTTVAGNVPLKKTTKNALKILSLIGRTDIPVAAGASAPLSRPLHTAEGIHGESGLDGPPIPDATFEADERSATELLADTIENSSEPVVLVPVGPLTNVAMFLRERPDLRPNISRVVLMGGSIGLGNTTPAAEFNIYVDPEAAREVFSSNLPITMCGLDVTHEAGAGPKEREKLCSLGELGSVVAGFLEFFAGAYKKTHGFDAPPLHDPVAVASIIEPEILKTRAMHVAIECEGELTRGETVCDVNGVTGNEANADVGVGLDRERFFEILHGALARL